MPGPSGGHFGLDCALGASPCSRLTRPPFDLELARLDRRRLLRLAKAMDLRARLDDWLRQYDAYQADADVQANAATGLRL